ncbi:hypothetical protein C8A00DRAFT_16381 [Chaetomidium leptoderma]|uniref:Uncharacterized protein n=1 Tax=Chaetomidium leptoderma TaxID=669021 RepID=A0AAN6VIR0_9PEZI|nr:hypothetical protein C8A00DRAFT_16381 [Chaetomidium leptoderma]
MGSRKSSLSISSGPVAPGAGSGPFPRRERSPSDAGELCIVDGRNRDEDEPDRSTVGTPYTPRSLNPRAQEYAAGERRAGKDETDASVHGEEDAPTPGAATPDEHTPEAAEVSTDGVTPHTPSSSGCSDASDSCDEGGGRPTPKADDNIIHEVCDQVLPQAFGVQLEDLALAGAVSAVYKSVSYCLDELSHIVLNSGLGNTGILISESTRGRTGSSTVPIWPAGATADSVGAGGGDGGSQGNGGGNRKRANGGHDGADPGDGAGDGSPAGGKRQKVSPTHYQAAGMHFSCPFRKRNPVRFNVRDFQSCAVQPFSDMTLLKRAMRTQKALDEHVSVGRDQICTPQKVLSSADPEDGITLGVEELLNERKADGKIHSWDSLWRLLFPEDCDILESDFVPPTELDEVYAQFNTDDCSRELRQRIQEGPGPTGDTESMLAIFSSHIKSVFEACRLKKSGVAGGHKRMRLQAPQQKTRTCRRNSVRLTPGHPTAGRRGSGPSDSSISSPVVTPSSTNTLGSLEQPLMVEPHPQMSYAPLTGGYHGGAEPDAARGFVQTSLVPGPGTIPNASQGGRSVTVAPPAHMNYLGFGGQSQDTVGMRRGQLEQHPRLLPIDSGIGLNATFLDQRATSFSNVSLFGPQNAYSAPGFGQRLPIDCLQAFPREMQGGLEQVFSPADPNMDPAMDFSEVPEMHDNRF